MIIDHLNHLIVSTVPNEIADVHVWGVRSHLVQHPLRVEPVTPCLSSHVFDLFFKSRLLIILIIEVYSFTVLNDTMSSPVGINVVVDVDDINVAPYELGLPWRSPPRLVCATRQTRMNHLQWKVRTDVFTTISSQMYAGNMRRIAILPVSILLAINCCRTMLECNYCV